MSRARRDPSSPPATPYTHHSTYFTDEVCLQVMQAVLKQLSEKLDVVRECAGVIFEDLVTSAQPRIPCIPERAALEAAIRGAPKAGEEGGGAESIMWSSPTMTFPIVAKIMSLESYHEVGKGVAGIHSTSRCMSWVAPRKYIPNILV